MYLKLNQQAYFDTLPELLILVTLANALPPREPALLAGDLGGFILDPLAIDLDRDCSVLF